VLAWFLKGQPIRGEIMERWARIGTLTACVALAFGCDRQTEVQRQTRDLQEAQKNVAKVRQELEGQLEQAKADVARLEQKVALARQGLTDDVLENQKELQAALQEQEHRVETELGQAKREAQIHSRDTEAALRQLGQTTAPAADPAPAPPGIATPLDTTAAAPATEPSLAPGDAPREERVPVKGTDTTGTQVDIAPEPEATPPAPPAAPPQPTSPVTDPTGAVPPAPPPAARDTAPSDEPPLAEPAPPPQP
jgi:TolA-binding protein